jgi:drug/metabolite transporter (DMT)-like permease
MADVAIRPAVSSATRNGIALTLLAMLCFAAMDGVSKVLAGALSIPQILWVRYIVFTLLALAVLRRKGIGNVWRSSQPLLQGARAALLVVENGLFVLAFKFLPLADVHAIAAAAPLLVIALSVPMLGETVGLRRWLAVTAGFIGVLLIVRPGFQEISAPILIAIAGALLWALYQILVRLCARTDNSDTTWLWSAVIGLLVTSGVGPFTWVWPDAQGWLLLVAIAVLGSAAHLALIHALTIAEASVLQPFGYTLLLWAALIGYLWFGDVPDSWTLTGAAIILLSGVYAWHRERLRNRQRRER